MKTKHVVGIIGFATASTIVIATLEYRRGKYEGILGNRPFKAYHLDVNDDGLKDIVVRSSGDQYWSIDSNDFIFLQDAETGLYNRLEDVIKTERGLHEGRVQDMTHKYEERIKSMTNNVDEKIKQYEAEHKGN